MARPRSNGDSITIKVRPFLSKRGKTLWYMGVSDWNKSRLSFSNEFKSEKATLAFMRGILKDLKETLE